MNLNNPRLTEFARALKTASFSKADGQLVVPPIVGLTLEFPEVMPGGGFSGAAVPPGGEYGFFWRDAYAVTGVAAGQTRTSSAGLAPGIWDITGHFTMNFSNAAPAAPNISGFVSMLDFVVPANSIILAEAFMANQQVQCYQQFKLRLNVAPGTDWRLRMSCPATLAGDVLSMAVGWQVQRMM